MEKRRHDRITNQKFLVNVSDGKGFFTGTVKDFSRAGLQLDDLPKRLDGKAKTISVVIDNSTTNFKLKAKTRWTKQQAISQMVGFEIVNAPWGWAEFVLQNQKSTSKTPAEITI